jgi:hypothetical protein
VIGDLTGDGKPELASGNGAGTVSVLSNRGGGSFGAKRDYRTSAGESYSVAAGDLSGDGKLDLVTANVSTNTVSVLTNRGDGSFVAEREYRAAGFEPEEVVVGDLNGDSREDLAVANFRGNGVVVLLNATGLCGVPNLKGKTVSAAKQTLARADCRVGRIRRHYSKIVARGRVISLAPAPGTVLPKRGKVNLVVSRGRKR